MKNLFKAIGKYKKEAILGPLFKLMEAFFDLLVPIIVAIIIDNGINGKNSELIKSYGVFLIVLAIIGICISIIAQYFAAKVSVKVASELRNKVFRKIEYLSFKDFENQGKSKLINIITNDTYQIQNGLNLFLRLALRSPLIVFGSCIAAFLIRKEIGYIFLGIIILVSIVILITTKISIKKFKSVQKEKDTLLDVTKDELVGAKEIRAFRIENNEKNKFEKISSRLSKFQNKAYNSSSIMNIFNYVIINIGIMGILYLGAINVNFGSLSQGELVALLNYSFQILIEIVKLTNLLLIIPKVVVSSMRIDEVMEIKNTNKKAIIGVSDEDETTLEFKNIYFSYANEKNVLEDISFSIKEGETLGIIGGISSGKTTLINLIDRLYENQSGEILLNGIDLNEYNVNFLRKNIAIVTQDRAIFNDSIRNNLLFGNKDESNRNIYRAIELAEFNDFVESKETKESFEITEGGNNLSGGQAKRLMIARALTRNPKILILDDSMAALDNLTELKILFNLKEYSKNKILILVSQKINTIKGMDNILVLDQGKVVGYGNHNLLLKNCKIYREIYESQI